jgi:hypothetical protein
MRNKADNLPFINQNYTPAILKNSSNQIGSHENKYAEGKKINRPKDYNLTQSGLSI